MLHIPRAFRTVGSIGATLSLPGTSPLRSQSDITPHRHRRERHRPQTFAPEREETYHVLTLHTDTAHYQNMRKLRERYYPPALLRVAAHISLFRALPGSMLPSIRTDIATAASQTVSFGICAVGPPIRMGQSGVGVLVKGLEPVEGIVRTLQGNWKAVLSQQDRGKFRGHYTMMNKVDDPEKVEKCIRELRREFEPQGCSGTALGLSLWRYDAGWWRHEENFAFNRRGRY
ncbi:hypothetical protein GGR54DRAFT_106320 [Hypoxylon sp. NC1633]|nr:hypothetical protein GGR54DRAFT_106320 [Hypoxylon sp. NC1633]